MARRVEFDARVCRKRSCSSTVLGRLLGWIPARMGRHDKVEQVPICATIILMEQQR